MLKKLTKKTHRGSTTNVLWNWYHQNARFFIDNMLFGECVFQQPVDIYMGTSCAFIRTSYTSYSSFSRKTKKLVRSFNCMLRYIDDVVLINNSKFGDFVYRLYPIELDLRMPQMQLDLLHTLTVMVDQQQNFTTKETI